MAFYHRELLETSSAKYLDVDPFRPPPFPLANANNEIMPLNRPGSAGRMARTFNGGFDMPGRAQPAGGNVADRLDQLEYELSRLKNTTSSSMRSSRSSGKLVPLPNAPAPPPQPVMHMPVPYPMPVPMPSGGASGGAGSANEHEELMVAHRELLQVITKQQEDHNKLLVAHQELMAAHLKLTGGGNNASGKKKVKPPSLGVVRLDYDYPAAEGDTDCPASFGYDVYYRVCPGLTFEMAQEGSQTEAVDLYFAEAIKFLEMKGVSAITGDCGFMMAYQVKAREIARAPVFMSSMVQCPVIATCLDRAQKILILTANAKTLKPQKKILLNKCGFDILNDNRFIIVGCQDVPGFDAVAKGAKVPLDIVQPGILKLFDDIQTENPDIGAILLECTELPPYADALRYHTRLPVWDAITAADFYVTAFADNPRFGINDWQQHWDGVQEEYRLGMNLIDADREDLIHQDSLAGPVNVPGKMHMDKIHKVLQPKQCPTLGVIRLDYNYPPAKGDIDHPASYDYALKYRTVPGLTFELAQSGKMPPQILEEFKIAIKWLESEGCVGITGDCGFMMAYQVIARQIADVPVFMSSMVQCPMISLAFDEFEKVLVLTANSESLKPQKEALLNHCGFDVNDDRFLIQGCQDVPGFGAVARGEKVDVAKVTPGIVQMVTQLIKLQPTVKAILSECTELPPYSDALREATGLPVFDAITCADFFIGSFLDNPRFGMNQWQNDWDGAIHEYKLGENLSAAEKRKLLHRANTTQLERQLKAQGT